MIYSSINVTPITNEYPAAITRALDYLKNHDILSMEPGRYDVEGSAMFALVQDLTTLPVEEKKPESHVDYIDIQYLVKGAEIIGFVPDTGKFAGAKEPNADLIFYSDVTGETFLTLAPGDFCVFFPSDIHRPGVQAGESMVVRKVVMKIHVDLVKE